MAIVKVKDPISNKDITLVKGTVNGIFFNDLKEVKDRGTQGKTWIPTHIIKVQIDKDYIGLGLTDKDKVGVKDADGNWHDLAKGMEVTALVTTEKVTVKGVEYTNYNSSAKNVTVNDASKAQAAYVPPAKGQAAAVKEPFNSDGMNTGHSINAAMLLCNDKMPSTEEFLELCKFTHSISEKVKVIHGKKLGLSPKSQAVGGSVGNAILTCCKLLTVAKKDKLEEKTLSFLSTISEPLLDFIKNGDPKPEVKEEKVVEQIAQTQVELEDEDLPF